MPVSPARAAAFDILLRVERESSYASDLLHSSRHANLSPADHALTTELVMGVLRWRSSLDRTISQASSQPLDRLDLEVLIALRLAVYQFEWLTRIPVRAALNESVELVKRARKKSAAPFVNAVLRKLSNKMTPGAPPLSRRSLAGQGGGFDPAASSSSRESEIEGGPAVQSSPANFAESYAHPDWLLDRWLNHYGPEATQKICQYNQSIPPATLRLRTPTAEDDLIAEGIVLAHAHLLSSARRVISGDITKTNTFRAGAAVIQDEASQLVAALVGPGHAEILDCCAAPGGKTLAIADQNPHAPIIAVELHPHRARRMRILFRDHSPQIQVLAADARQLPLTHSFDRILADVPCSGTGTLARNPEIKWRLKLEDLPDLQWRQLAILRSAARHLKPAAHLIYSTCSLEKEENEDVVDQLLKEDAHLHLVDCRQELDRLQAAGILTCPDPASLTRGPYLRTIPGIHPCDGFFAALIEAR